MSRAMFLAVLAVPFGSAAFSEPEKSDQANNALSIAQVGRLLKEMGCEPKELTAEVWQVSIVRNAWKVNVMFSLAPNADRLWMESKFAEIVDPEAVPATAWFKLLAENERIGPCYFAFDRSDSRIHLYRSMNNIALTSSTIKKELDDFDAVVRKTQKLWRSEAFAPGETLPIPPREIENDKKILPGSMARGGSFGWKVAAIRSRKICSPIISRQ